MNNIQKEQVMKMDEQLRSIQENLQYIQENLTKLDEPIIIEFLGTPKSGKTTLVSLLGIDECKSKAQALTNEALEILNSFNGNSHNLKAITEYLLTRNY